MRPFVRRDVNADIISYLMTEMTFRRDFYGPFDRRPTDVRRLLSTAGPAAESVEMLID